MTKTMSTEEARALTQRAASAMRTGDALGARGLLQMVVEAGRADAGVWLGLAYANQRLGDDEAKLAAIDQSLALQPRNPRALILKADHMMALGDERAATAFYTSALRLAPRGEALPPDLASDLRRAEAACAEAGRRYEAHLRERLASVARENGSRRFEQSLDIMLGKKRIYLQEPSVYYFPELPQIQFYDRADFPWIAAMESVTDDIRDELRAVMADSSAFKPYVEADPRRPSGDPHAMIGNESWGAFHFWKSGQLMAEAAERCPRTMQALEAVPLAHVPGRTPTVLFSLLQPGAHIPPHRGLVNTRLICHLPLVAPEGCRFRVGNETRAWKEGEMLVFDDTIEHEAWNDSGETRVVLLFDVWRPELTLEERELVIALFAAVDAYDASPTSQAG